jgi:outer membrane biosynthesis protein TonB
LQIGIDEQGRVIDPYPLRASHPRFAEAAVDAVKQWRYRPAACDGKPRKILSEVMVTFER